MARQPNCIARLNDAFRSQPGPDFVITRGVLDLGPTVAAQAVQRVLTFDEFTPANDPHGEHDFGALSIDGEKLFWKIDYYDRELKYGSPDPSDPALTRRVLTIMLASEY